MGKKPVVIGIAGGSGSGKTTVTKAIYEYFKGHSIMLLEQDYYYKDQSDVPFEQRLQTNYDHPLAFDNDLLIEHLQNLLNYESIDKPVYDYAIHTRSEKVIREEPKDVIILEGILVLEDQRLRNLMDIKLYVDTDADLRIIRRMLRDIKERERTLESVVDQYVSVVRPMHNQFVEPTKRYADIIIPEGGQNHVAIDLMVTKIQTILEQNAIL
ncbi:MULTISPECIES: uridine kinase [Priestia]|jgi:uridine kinase|uniref:Uridine kinase n=6 Tax=Priestia TaxID=2800373 RepID=D5DSZ5_PRIM1|nr:MULTISPECIES: uridine kinase [Priestia]AVX10482.1 uridine kinase [Bacillus sp. Y-01]KOP76559.1 uridine kinase [Bacillus sp. FJAT-21351]KQU14502.1 uridine kinase [Bacillus sp. Leaf75]KRD92426.1 uridine kinase [Bacillus sp. Root239]KRF57862.1 uridine kinase [Bacillus sp. Soil531]MBZ5477899.1 uridine kinase [Bacillus sp. T_4]MCF6798475.1 uridine kinase [Bacillus sp. ET1]MCJ7990845.1 uridine kinase [Priestia sp. OVS21]MDH6652383.1 uridine kinase [Bacillus sp. PvP124]MDP9577528.1 uridine ki